MALLDFTILGSSQFKAVIIDCSVESTGYKHMVTLNWTLLNKNDLLRIREYSIYCNCSDYETDLKKVCMCVCVCVCVCMCACMHVCVIINKIFKKQPIASITRGYVWPKCLIS